MSDAPELEASTRASVWGNLTFRRFWVGESVSQVGDRVSELAIPLIAVVMLHATPREVGLLTAAVWTPNLLSLLVGSWVENQPSKQRLMVIADLARFIVLLSIPIAWALDALTLPQLFAVALLSGFGQVLFGTSYPPFYVAIVPKRDYVEANSLISISRSTSFIAGPALGGGLVQLLTAPIAVLVDAVSFLYSAWVIGRLDVTERPVDRSSGESWRQRVWSGLKFVVTHSYLRASLACATTVNFFTFMAAALLILFASRTLGLSAGVIGLAFGIGAVGGLLGAFAAPRLSRRFGIGRMVVVGAILFPAPIAVIAIASGPTWVEAVTLGAAEFVSGFGVMLFDINLNSVQTSVIPDALRSRVSGAFTMINYGVRPLGAVLGGVLGAWLGLRETLLLASVGGALCFLWLLPSPIPKIFSLDDVESPDDVAPAATLPD